MRFLTKPFARLSALSLGAGLALLASPAALADEEHPADVENFSYSSWELAYELTLDDAGRAHAQVTEELTAEFPTADQNRGIIRSLPLRYQGAPANPEDISVTDETGAAVPFEIDDDGEFRSILTGDDDYVHGEQTYVIEYNLSDVIHAPEDINEFYWDLVPADRQQDINKVTAEVSLDEQLASAVTGETSCYLDEPGGPETCQIAGPGDSPSNITIDPTPVPAGETLTIAVGFEAGTVVQPPQRQPNFVLDVLPVIIGGVAALLAAGGALAVLASTRKYRQVPANTLLDRGAPEGISPLLAAPLMGSAQQPVVATILDLAVRGAVRIEEDPHHVQRWYKKDPSPVLRLIDPALLSDPLERELLEGMFPGLAEGATFDFPKNDKKFTKTAQEVLRASREAALERGLQQRVWHRIPAIFSAGALVTLVIAVVLLIQGSGRDNVGTLVVTLVLAGVTLALALVCLLPHRVPTEEGAKLRAQLEQLRSMMKASENEPLEMLQSPDNAARIPTHDGDSGSQTVRLYDQLLPYAVLFGQQKQWIRVLASTYESQYVHHAPIWYPGLFNHGAQGLESSLNTMLSSVSSAASTSSSGAGSTGAGAAGGGGGGGAAGGR